MSRNRDNTIYTAKEQAIIARAQLKRKNIESPQPQQYRYLIKTKRSVYFANTEAQLNRRLDKLKYAGKEIIQVIDNLKN
ncbi:MAG: hypothetical protein N4A72_14615 [Bacteroidales bacterium]|jgi:hypothetical protein|nr:hypothetical protein [Bacteroidales bacterium]